MINFPPCFTRLTISVGISILFGISCLILGCGEGASDDAPSDEQDMSDYETVLANCPRLTLDEFDDCELHDRVNGLDDVREICESTCALTQGLRIEDASGITDLRFLRGVETTRRVVISGNPHLKNLNGFEGVDITDYGIWIEDNPRLESLEGLHELTDLREAQIFFNPRLTDLRGLRSLQRLRQGGLDLHDNYALRDLRGLESLEEIGGNVAINYNSSLPRCEVDHLLEQVEVSGDIAVGDNGVGECE